MDTKIKIGDRVILKSDETIKMTVNSFNGLENVECIYFNTLTQKFEFILLNIGAIENY